MERCLAFWSRLPPMFPSQRVNQHTCFTTLKDFDDFIETLCHFGLSLCVWVTRLISPKNWQKFFNESHFPFASIRPIIAKYVCKYTDYRTNYVRNYAVSFLPTASVVVSNAGSIVVCRYFRSARMRRNRLREREKKRKRESYSRALNVIGTYRGTFFFFFFSLLPSLLSFRRDEITVSFQMPSGRMYLTVDHGPAWSR